MKVCWKCKKECEKSFLVESKLKNFKAYICRKCLDGYEDSCETCGKSEFVDLMYCSTHIDITQSDPESYLNYCSYECADNNGEYIHECDTCKIIFEAPGVNMYQSDKTVDIKFYCSDYCFTKKNLAKCDKCEKLHKKDECFRSRFRFKEDSYLIYLGFDCCVCKTCKNSFKKSTEQNDIVLYREGFCCKECKSNFDTTFTPHTISELFKTMDVRFIELIKERESSRKLTVNSYSNFNLVCDKMKSLGWRIVYGDSTFFIKTIDGILFMVGRGFVYSPSDVLGRSGWLYNYVKDVDQSVIKELSKRYDDFKYILYFYEGRINYFK